MPDRVVLAVAQVAGGVRAPAWATAAGNVRSAEVGRVERPPGDHDPDVVGIGVDRDPAPGPRLAPGLKPAGGHRLGQQACPVQDVADRARAVVAAGVPGPVATRVAVGGVDDVIGRRYRRQYLPRRVLRGGGRTVAIDPGGPGGPAGVLRRRHRLAQQAGHAGGHDAVVAHLVLALELDDAAGGGVVERARDTGREPGKAQELLKHADVVAGHALTQPAVAEMAGVTGIVRGV